ncbi:MAG: efflux RND transporter permease subunit [Rhodobacteraceae bacterium]|nr:efflux RND transporter permease subunit [Paracoccaceae bacterium]MBR9820215.1 efflux RND transporter permease subunit [Paracoccaceae bacterium]
MSFNISAWAIHKPLPSLVLFSVLVVAGLVSFRALPITSMPEVEIPLVAVAVSQSGAAPVEMETQVTMPVEAAVSGLTGVRNVSSSVTDGQSVTSVEFELDVPVDRAVDDVRDAVSSIRGDLPGAVDEPVIQRVEAEGDPIATYAVHAPQLLPETVSWLIDNTVARALQGVTGVARVQREGGAEREIRVNLDPVRLRALGITAAEVSAQLARTTLDQAGGRSEIGSQEQLLRVTGAAGDIAALAALELILPGGRNVQLSELATVTDAQAEVRSIALQNGQPVTAFSVFVAPGFSAPVVAQQVADALETLDAENDDISIQLIDTSVRDIEASYAAAMDTLIEGAILAIVVVLIFLKDFRATLISSLAIPLSILPTFWLMSMFGFSLNTISLLAVTLVTGVLVDDAIVEIENIIRHMRTGKSAFQASIDAAGEIGLAVVATSATIIAVFLPVSFMSGIAGQYFLQFGITVAVSVAFSLLVARLITPLIAAYFMKDAGHAEAAAGPVLQWYSRLLDWTLRWRFLTITGGVVIFSISIFMATLLPSGLLPGEDGSRSVLNVELAPGVTMSDAEATMLRISDRLQAHPAVASVFASLGNEREMREGSVIITLVPAGERSLDLRGFERAAQADLSVIPDLKMSFLSGQGGREFSLNVSGPDGGAVARAAEALEAAIRLQVPELRNVQSNAAMDRPELRVVPRPADAAMLGVSAAEIASVLRIATLGDQSQELAKFSDGERLIDINVRLDDSARRDLATLETLLVRSSSGAAVPLMAVADIHAGTGPSNVARYNRERQILIEADLAPDVALSTALASVMALEEAQSLPQGVSLSEFGDAQLMQEVFSGFMMAMGAGLMLVLAVLILLFEDIFQPVTILLSLPLSIGGAMAALLLTGNAISLPVVIGFLMLIGIATKNAILLVDFAIEEIARGTPRRQALIDAGMKRAQPIVMTTIAMSAGMMPSALALGEGSGFRAPMAIAVIGGLMTSTALSLVFVPAMFTYMDDLSRFLRRVLGRFVTGHDGDVTAARPGERHNT